MTHDPLCPMAHPPEPLVNVLCFCTIIARVREG